MEYIEGIISIVARYLSMSAIFWVLPGTIMNIVVALGGLEKIIFIDEQLAEDLNKLYWPNGEIRKPLHSTIAIRLYCYWLTFPFIYKRSKTRLIKFHLFMWFNSIGIWSLFTALFIIFIEKNAK